MSAPAWIPLEQAGEMFRRWMQTHPAIDIGNKNRRRLNSSREAKIHEIAMFEIQFGNASGALYDDVIVV
jgi:hypothetical protein